MDLFVIGNSQIATTALINALGRQNIVDKYFLATLLPDATITARQQQLQQQQQQHNKNRRITFNVIAVSQLFFVQSRSN